MNARRTIAAAIEPRLDEGERVLAGGFAWVAVCRSGVPSFLLARRPHLLALTDRRIVLWRRPRRREQLDESHLVLDVPFAGVTLEKLRTFTPMLQVRIRRGNRSTLLELRPRDRRVGRRLADELRAAATAEAPAATSSV